MRAHLPMCRPSRRPGRARGSRLALLSLAMLAFTVSGAASEPLVHEVAVDGIALGVELTAVDSIDPAAEGSLLAGGTVRLRLDLRDTASATPLGGAEPAAWMSRRRGAAPPVCGEQVARYLTGDLFSRADVDFNVYYILSLNHDATLSVVDPLFGFGGSKILTMVLLESPGADWALMDGVDGGRLLVSQPEAGKVASITADTWQLEQHIEVAPGVTRLRPSVDGTLVWALDPKGLSAIDPHTSRLVERHELSSRALDFILSEQHAYVLLDGAGADRTGADGTGAVAVIELDRLRTLGTVTTGRDPSSIAWSHRGESAWVAHSDGRLLAVDLDPKLDQPRIRHRLETGVPIEQLRFAPDGRLGFAVSPAANQLFVLDAARARVIKSGPMAGGPEQVVFSDHLAYVRHRHSEQVLMVPLDTARVEGEPIQAADFPGGLHPLGHRSEDPRVLAPSFDRAPGAGAMVLANAEDQAIYFYMEGMAAPMGHFTVQGRRPLAVKVVDRSLRARGSGVYETFARLSEPGTYDLAVFLDAPRLIHCFSLEVAAPGPSVPAEAPIKLVQERLRFLPGGGVELWLERPGARGPADPAQDGPTHRAFEDEGLTLYVSRTAGGWHHRVRAEPLPVDVPGAPRQYRARVFPGRSGDYLVWAEKGAEGLAGLPPLARLRVPEQPHRGAHRKEGP